MAISDETKRARLIEKIARREVGRVVRRARKELGASQKELASAAGVEQSVMSKIESGTRGVDPTAMYEVVNPAMSVLEASAGRQLSPDIVTRIWGSILRVGELCEDLTTDELEQFDADYRREAVRLLWPAYRLPRRGTPEWRAFLDQEEHEMLPGPTAAPPGVDPFSTWERVPKPDHKIPEWVKNARAELRAGEQGGEGHRDPDSSPTSPSESSGGPLAASVAATQSLFAQLIEQSAGGEDAAGSARLLMLQRLLVSLAALDDDGFATVTKYASDLVDERSPRNFAGGL